jgi:hypothetical protein
MAEPRASNPLTVVRFHPARQLLLVLQISKIAYNVRIVKTAKTLIRPKTAIPHASANNAFEECRINCYVLMVRQHNQQIAAKCSKPTDYFCTNIASHDIIRGLGLFNSRLQLLDFVAAGNYFVKLRFLKDSVRLSMFLVINRAGSLFEVKSFETISK